MVDNAAKAMQAAPIGRFKDLRGIRAPSSSRFA
jgi:hypothetical protein